MRLGALAIIGVVLAIALAMAIPAMRGQPQVNTDAADRAETQIEAARSEVEFGPVTPEQQGPLLELRAAGKIAAEVNGSNIEQVSLHVINLTDQPLRVFVPAGTFFVANDAGMQSMVATSGHYIDLEGRQAGSVTIASACANLPLDIPDFTNSFTIAEAPPQAELLRIAPLLGGASTPYSVRQAAVWIITDNADYDDLGTLVSVAATSAVGSFGSRTRIIGPEEAAHAMQILDEAGVSIRNRRIWRDRGRIAENLPEGDLRVWLSNQ
jgi:hypothetical protein